MLNVVRFVFDRSSFLHASPCSIFLTPQFIYPLKSFLLNTLNHDNVKHTEISVEQISIYSSCRINWQQNFCHTSFRSFPPNFQRNNMLEIKIKVHLPSIFFFLRCKQYLIHLYLSRNIFWIYERICTYSFFCTQSFICVSVFFSLNSVSWLSV